MVQWFQERYIAREEHQRIVDYYRKLVAQLHGNVRDLRARAEAPVTDAPQPAEEPDDVTEEPAKVPQERALGPNVVSLGFYRDRRNSGA
jgi:hypothetical protein